MRVIGLAFAGVVALTAPSTAHAVSLGSNLGPVKAGTEPTMIQVWGGCGWGWHPVPGHWSYWRGGWVPPHCVPNRYDGGWGAYRGWRGPYYGGWGVYQGGLGGPYEGGDHDGS